jgi:hypothetical protein
MKENTWDMSNKSAREKQVKRDFALAYIRNLPHQKKLVEYDDYYNNEHYSKDQIVALAAEKGWDFVPPVLPDPFIQVESLIDPKRPDFIFKGREGNDFEKAKERQDAVEYVLYDNKIDDMIPAQERRVNKGGDFFWKVAFDGSIKGPGYIGKITVGDPDASNMFPLHPNIKDLDEQEMVFYVYPIHRRAACRKWGKKIDDLSTNNTQFETEIYSNTPRISEDDDMLQVIEAWYKDDDGDIACSVQIDFTEVQFIKKYWINTAASGNKMYPFVQGCKIPVDKSFWNKGEIEAIKDLVDTGDREFLMAVLHDCFDADDMIVCERNALEDGTTIQKTPGGIIYVKDGKRSAIGRLGDMGTNYKSLEMIEFIHQKIQETNGNFDPNQGKAPPSNVKTLGGMQLLNDKGEARKDLKKADRNSAYRRLYELIDWTILEFYNQSRIIQIRGNVDFNNKNKEAIQAGQMEAKPTTMEFNSDNYKVFDRRMYETLMNQAISNGEEVEPGVNDEEYYRASVYYPGLDTEIILSNPIQQSKAFTVQATSDIANQMENLTPAKAELLKSSVENMGLPNGQEIKNAIDQSTIQPVQQAPGMHPVDQMLSQLTPEQQDDLLSRSPEEQATMLKQLMGGTENG